MFEIKSGGQIPEARCSTRLPASWLPFRWGMCGHREGAGPGSGLLRCRGRRRSSAAACGRGTAASSGVCLGPGLLELERARARLGGGTLDARARRLPLVARPLGATQRPMAISQRPLGAPDVKGARSYRASRRFLVTERQQLEAPIRRIGEDVGRVRPIHDRQRYGPENDVRRAGVGKVHIIGTR